MFYSDYKTILSTVNSFTKTSLNIEIVSSDEGKHMNPTQEKQNDFIFFSAWLICFTTSLSADVTGAAAAIGFIPERMNPFSQCG